MSLIYYGLSFNISDLGGNPYINCAISGAVEIPAYILAYWMLGWAGRLKVMAATLATSGLSLLATIAVPLG